MSECQHLPSEEQKRQMAELLPWFDGPAVAFVCSCGKEIHSFAWKFWAQEVA